MAASQSAAALSKKYGIRSSSLCLEMRTPVVDDRDVYIAGNFNGWITDDPRFRMQHAGGGAYYFAFPADWQLPSPLEYKYVKAGGWSEVELDSAGQLTDNRKCRKKSGWRKDQVAHWRKGGRRYNYRLKPSIEIISEHFEIPQLGRSRRVSVLLPYNYGETLRRYPVLYLQDGQNLFDDEAPFGNWSVDKKLAMLAERGMGDLIIVAIDHGGRERIKEFTPYKAFNFEGGDGMKYVDFICDTLKPVIDARYRTLPDQQHTGIGGSSLGGLISMYAGVLRPHVFSKWLIFSPSLWAAPKLKYEMVRQMQKNWPLRIYLYAGGRESKGMLPEIRSFKQEIDIQAHFHPGIEATLSIDARGRHNEHKWGIEFPEAIEWLYFRRS